MDRYLLSHGRPTALGCRVTIVDLSAMYGMAAGPEVRQHTSRTEPDAKQRGLVVAAKTNMEACWDSSTAEHGSSILATPRRRLRRQRLLAVAIMANHIHVVVGVPGDPEPDTLLRDFKSYASLCLNKSYEGRRAGHGGRSPVHVESRRMKRR